MSKYLIGIDFGTTNCTMAYALAGEEKSEIKQAGITQTVALGLQNAEPVLPSCIYFPLAEELSDKVGASDREKERAYLVGRFARERGAELPFRIVTSAKSWLCHEGIDRREPMLPLGFDSDRSKISPLKACSDILLHLREAWDQAMPEDPFSTQYIHITVPASFDPSARQLILEAAAAADYPEVILLEEPLAAFYAWLYRSQETWRKELSIGDHILVIDIGGGTTDFSLISLTDDGGDLHFDRTAVGAHLLLGGDNIDLSLAYLAKSKFEAEGHEIDDGQMHAIVQAAREAKEKFLGDEPIEKYPLTIMGRGSRLIGGSLRIELQREEVLELILDGFFPSISMEEQSKSERHAGIRQVGLPYVKDPRVTCQLAKFLSRTGEGEASTDKFIIPKAVLFNGGTTKSTVIRERLLAQLNRWANESGRPEVHEVSNADYDFAVSRGAVYYGMARTGKAIRVRGGTARSYFVGVEDAAPAVPGMPTPIKAVCVVPFGMEEGTEQTLDAREFALILGEQASFRFFSRSTESLEDGSFPVIGTTVKKWKQELTELHTLDTLLDKGPDDGKTIQVRLTSKVTELGVLELWCIAKDGRKWKLEFDIRK